MSKQDGNVKVAKIWGLTRISLGVVFLWAFFDKLIGLGFATCRDAETSAIDVMCSKAWLNGGSPTTGFLNFGTSGPFAEFYQGLAGNSWVDWLFMIGLLGIGAALVFGVGMRIAAITGSLLMMMMWTATLWPENNPIIDDHVIYSLVLIGLWKSNAGQFLGFGMWWQSTNLVKKYPLLK